MSANYIWGTGRRKTAVARVRVRAGSGEFRVNGKPFATYFPTIEMLSRSFLSLPSESVSLAYLQSYWMARDLVDQHGFEAFEALVADLEADPQRKFDESFRVQFGDWPDVYLDRWYEDFLAE